MWGSFYLGSVLNCDCVLRALLGDFTPATGTTSQMNIANQNIALPDIKKGQQSKSFTDTVVADPSISISSTSLCLFIDSEDGTISGEGRVYCGIQISQNKLYFEVHVVSPGNKKVQKE